MKKANKKMINFALFLLGILLLSITFNIFCVPNNYVTGGVSGISIIFKYLFDIDVSATLLVGNLLLIVIGIIVLGIKDTTPSIIGALFYTLGVYLTENINTYLNIHLSSPFLNIITIGVLFGIGSTMIYLAGYSTGGTDILGIIFNKKYGMELGQALLIINALIIILGTFIFGIEMLIITLLIRFLESTVVDKLLIGKSDSKVLFINSEKLEEIKEFIIHEIKSGISEIKVTTGFNQDKKPIIMCVVPTEKYLLLKEKIIEMDKGAFITILDAYEVYGGTNRYKLPLHDFRMY